MDCYSDGITVIVLIVVDETKGGEVQFSKLMEMLESDSEISVQNSLKKLSNLTAFKEFQVKFISVLEVFMVCKTTYFLQISNFKSSFGFEGNTVSFR